MTCLTPDFPFVHHYERPIRCLQCPFNTDPECFKGVIELTADVVYVLPDGRRVRVRAGFCTDGASIPQAVWAIMGHPFSRSLLRAALLHDVLYHANILPKEEADGIFLAMLEADGVSWLKRQTIYRAVRLFGGGSYNKSEACIAYSKQFIEIQPA